MAEFTVNIADLRIRITFRSPTILEDAGGAQVPGYANIATNPTVWARRINSHGQEFMNSDAAKASQRAEITVRYRSDILPTWQILMDGAYWQIISPPDHVQGRGRWTVFIVELVKGTV